MLKAGIDEAGRGAVFGPLVVAGVALTRSAAARLLAAPQTSQSQQLQQSQSSTPLSSSTSSSPSPSSHGSQAYRYGSGLRDSKQVPASKRIALAADIRRLATAFRVVRVPARAIDEAVWSQVPNMKTSLPGTKISMSRAPMGLNALEMRVSLRLAAALARDCFAWQARQRVRGFLRSSEEEPVVFAAQASRQSSRRQGTDSNSVELTETVSSLDSDNDADWTECSTPLETFYLDAVDPIVDRWALPFARGFAGGLPLDDQFVFASFDTHATDSVRARPARDSSAYSSSDPFLLFETSAAASAGNGWGMGDISSFPLSPETKVVAAVGADVQFACVAAASILAKVDRDAAMVEIEEAYGKPLGSGYPADPLTKQALERAMHEADSLPHFIRQSWKTVSKLQQ